MNRPLNVANAIREATMKPTILQIQTSLYAADALSSQLASRYTVAWRDAHPAGEVIVRDLASNPVPHLTAERFAAFTTAPAERTPGQREVTDFSDELIDELRRADVIVFSVPMYNFGIPSQLKAYFDHVARAGVTFRYGANGPEGLLKGKHAYVFATRGGIYANTPNDTQEPYLRQFLRFIGIEDVEFVYAEGLAMGADLRERAIAQANVAIDRITEALPQLLAA